MMERRTMGIEKAMEYIKSYRGGTFDQLNLASKLLTALHWNYYYPSNRLIEKFKKFQDIDSDLAKEIDIEGINYYILFNDRNPANGFHYKGMATYLDEWYVDLNQELIRKLKNNEENWNSIQELIYEIKDVITSEVNEMRLLKNIANEFLNDLISEEES